MDDYNPRELIAVCESILEDGEISGEEIYGLAEWLNEHGDACVHWPGEWLVSPLQQIWSDAKVTKTELRQIGRLLVRIQKDWAKRQAEHAFQRATEAIIEIARCMDLSQPRLPAIPFVARVKSHTEKGVFYEVDLSGPSCTCPDWRSKRHKLPAGHISRCCKHVFDAYGQHELEDGWPGWFGAFLELAWTPQPQKDWMVLRSGRSLVLASTAPAGWADVFAERDGDYERFGYNVPENRWAYGEQPRGGREISRAILEASNR